MVMEKMFCFPLSSARYLSQLAVNPPNQTQPTPNSTPHPFPLHFPPCLAPSQAVEEGGASSMFTVSFRRTTFLAMSLAHAKRSVQ